jgi:hypothetical protein
MRVANNSISVQFVIHVRAYSTAHLPITKQPLAERQTKQTHTHKQKTK